MLVGRSLELQRAASALAGSSMVVLVGPAGIGKSTLARSVLGARGPFREAGALSTLDWVPMFVFQRLLGTELPEEPEAVAGAVVARGSEPVLFDDLQWADDASLEVIGHLAGEVPIVATVRSGTRRADEVVAAVELVGAVRIDLGGLAPQDASELAAALHPALTPTRRAELVAVAAGNPLLLRELPLGSAAEPSLVSALVSRLASLSPEASSAVQRLAVLGRPAMASVLGPGVAELPAVGLAAEVDGSFGLPHPLLGEVLVDGLGPEADAIRRDLVAHVDAAEGAHLLAQAGDLAEARRAALVAADTSDRRTRAAMLDLAIRCAPDLDADSRLTAARLHTSLGAPHRAFELCDCPGREDLPAAQRGGLLAAAGEARWYQGRHQEAIELIERALVDLRGSRTAMEVATLAGSTVAETFIDLDGRPALDRAKAAVRLADELGVEQGFARSRLASVLLTAGEPGWAELYEQVVELARRDGDRDLRRTALVGNILGHWVTGRAADGEVLALAEVAAGPRQEFDLTWLTYVGYAAILGLAAGRDRRELLTRYEPILERWPRFRSRSFIEATVALSLADLGDHVRATEVHTSSTARRHTDPQWRSIAWWIEADLAWQAGRFDEVAACLEQVELLGFGSYPSGLQVRLLGAHAARGSGRAPAGEVPRSDLPAWRPAEVEWTGIAAAVDGDHDRAVRSLLDAADGWAGSDVRSELRCRWAAGDVAAVAGRPDAVALLDAAEVRAEALGHDALLDRVRGSLRSLGVARRATVDRGVGALTHREEQALDLVGAGMTSPEIAAALRVKPSTIESLVRGAMRKLDAPTRTAAAVQMRHLRGAADVVDRQELGQPRR